MNVYCFTKNGAFRKLRSPTWYTGAYSSVLRACWRQPPESELLRPDPFDGGANSWRSVGLKEEAVARIVPALASAGLTAVASIGLLPSRHTFVARWSPADIT